MGSREGAARASAARAEARAATLASLEAQAAKVRVVLTGCDTLELHTGAPLRAAFVRQLESMKEQAQAMPKGEPGPLWPCAGHAFEVKRGGNRRGPLWLESEAMALSVNPWAPDGLPTAMIELRARHLWADLDVAGQDAEEVLSVLTEGETPDAQVSRVDVTVDWQGWEPAGGLLDAFTCRARSDSSYRKNRRHTGWSWGGGGSVLARVYDKTREIAGSDKAEWFPEVWKAAGRGWVPGEPVWRCEFQVRREAVRELGNEALEEGVLRGWAGCREHLGSIWSTLSDSWLSLRLGRTGKSRQNIDPRWAALRTQAQAWNGCAPAVDLERVQRETEFRRTLDQLGGYLARGIAERWALYGEDDSLHVASDKLFSEVCNHLGRKGQSLDEKVRELLEPMKAAAAVRASRRRQRQRDEESRQRALLH